MNLRYAYSLHEQAVRELVAAEDDERREVINLCEALTRSLACRRPNTYWTAPAAETKSFIAITSASSIGSTTRQRKSAL
jgi:hypothetical protein